MISTSNASQQQRVCGALSYRIYESQKKMVMMRRQKTKNEFIRSKSHRPVYVQTKTYSPDKDEYLPDMGC